MSHKKTSPVRPFASSNSPQRPPTPEHIKKEKIGASPASTPFNQFQYYRPQKYQGTRSVVKKISPTGRTEATHAVDPPAVEMHPYFQHSALEQQQIQELESFKAIEKTSSQPGSKAKAAIPTLDLDELGRSRLPSSFLHKNNPLSSPYPGSFKEDFPARPNSSQKKTMVSHKLKDLNEMRKLRRDQRQSQYSGSQNSIIGSPLATKNPKFQQLEALQDLGGYQMGENPYSVRRESNEHFAMPVVVKEMSDDELLEEQHQFTQTTLKKSSFMRTPVNQDKFFDFEGQVSKTKSIRQPKDQSQPRPLTSKPKIHSYSVLEPTPEVALTKKTVARAKPKITIPNTPKGAGGHTSRLKPPAQLKNTTLQSSKKAVAQTPLKKGKAPRQVQRAPTDLALAPKTRTSDLPKSSFISSSQKGSFIKKGAPVQKPVPQTPQAKTTISLTKAMTALSSVKQVAAKPKMLTGKAEVNKVPVLPLRQKPGMLTSRHKQVQTKQITINLELTKKQPSSASKL